MTWSESSFKIFDIIFLRHFAKSLISFLCLTKMAKGCFGAQRRPRSRRGSCHVRSFKSHLRSASKISIWGLRFSASANCLQFGTESDIFGCDFRFLLDFVPVVFLSNFRSYSRGSSCCFRYYFNVFDIFRCHYCGFLRFPYDSIRFHAYNYIIPYDSMHGTIWFHVIPCMEPYDSMRFHAWNHIILCDSMHGNDMKLLYGTIWFHAWNRMEDLWVWIRGSINCFKFLKQKL